MRRTLGWLLLVVLLSGCAGNAHPVLKLGVVAPFEGRGRSLGYDVLASVELAVAEANHRGDFGPYRVLVTAYNDDLDPRTAARQASALAVDFDVFGVVGPFTAETTAAAGPVLATAGVPNLPVESRDPAGRSHPVEVAEAKKAARALLQALAAAIAKDGVPTRAGVARQLGTP